MLLALDFKPPIHPPSSRCSWSYKQDNSALQDKASMLQEKAKALAKEKKGILFLLWCLYFLSSFFCAHVRLALTELKSLLLKKGEMVTDLTNIMYRQTNAVEKLTKIKADSDKCDTSGV